MKRMFTLITLLLLISSCRNVKEIKTYEQLRASQGKQLQIVTSDSAIYYTSKFTVWQNLIEINGTRSKGSENKSWFGEIPFKDIVYIRTGNEEILPPFLIAGITVVYFFQDIDFITTPSGVNSEVKYAVPYSGGGGSCPFVYSWDGSKYTIEGETFGTSLGKGLENETAIVLNSLRSVDGKVKIKITNERPETHFFNTVELFAVETDFNTDVSIDNQNRIVNINQCSRISKALDESGKDITSLLLKNDDEYWESDLSSANIISGFEDIIYTEFLTGAGDSVSIAVTARNTKMSDLVFAKLGKELGDDFMAFTKAAETDSEIKSFLKKILNSSALKIDFWNGTEWEYGDIIYPEANQVDFIKVVRLPSVTEHGKMAVRLRCMTDIWKINSIKHTSGKTNGMEVYKLSSANQMDYKLSVKDDNYLVLLPGEEINLEYNEVTASPGRKITYVLKSGGYLYEYIIDSDNYVNRLNPDDEQTARIKKILFNNFSLYAGIYKDWKKTKNLKI
jgi:hypothetical protein